MPSKPKKWLKLDNAAKIYPAAKSRHWTALFRVSVLLKEPVDPQILEQAQRSTVKRFPAFGMRLKRGFFWYYLENIDLYPPVYPDVSNPCVRMNLKENDGFMFRVRYYQNRIALEVFHVLADGTGGLCFLKTLVAEYLRLKYGEHIPRDQEILDCSEQPRPEEYEDSFLKYAGTVGAPRKEPVAYQLKGTVDDRHYMNIITGVIPAAEIIRAAKSYGASVTEFLTAVMIQCICTIQRADSAKRDRRRPVKICIPINLRQFYPSVTMRNFASYVNPGIEPSYGDYSLEETIAAVHHFMGLEVTRKKMTAKMTTNVKNETNKIMRSFPLFLKNPAMKAAFLRQGDRQASCTISNLGLQKLPEEMARHVERMDFMLGSLSVMKVTCACVTYHGNLVVNFTRAIREPVLERLFFTTLVKMGIHVTIESNQR